MSTKSASRERKLSKIEQTKADSNFLREPLATELLQDTSHFSEAALQILKFHGSYQQDNRDSGSRTYQVWLGGTTNGTKLARPYVQKVKSLGGHQRELNSRLRPLKIEHLKAFLEPILLYFRANRELNESFGEFCNRISFDRLSKVCNQFS